jgi:hypothetical protein
MDTELPITCDPHVFTHDERVAHLKLCTDVLLRWPKERIERDDGFVYRFVGDEALFTTLAAWAAAEHRCCPWARYSVALAPFAGEGAIEVRVEAPPEGKAFLADAYRTLAELDGRLPPASILSPEKKLTRQDILKRLLGGCGC